MPKALIRALGVALLCAVAVTAPAAEQPWVEVRSPHFALITDAGEKRGREVLQRFENMRTAFGVLFKKATINIPIPLQIIAFRNTSELRRYAPLWNGKPVELAGFFQGATDKNFIALDLSSEGGWAVAFHEYAHMLINGNFPPEPAWYDEGFAEYCSTLKVSNKEIDIGLIPEGDVQVLRDNPWLKSIALLSIEHTSQEYNAGERRGVFYAESWLLVHYYMGRENSPLNQLVLMWRNKVPVDEAIRKAFGMSPDQVDHMLREYYLSGRWKYFKVSAPAEINDIQYTARALSGVDAAAILADLHYHSRDYQEAAFAEFKRILTLQPDNAIANRGLGYAYLQRNQFDEAADHFRRAAAQDSQDPWVHFLSASLMYRQSVVAQHNPGDVDLMRKELETAIRLNPGFADAHALLAFNANMSEDRKGAIAAMRKALELNPRNDSYAMNLAQFYLQDRKYDDAAPLLERLRGSDDQRIATQASVQADQLAELKELAKAEPGRQAVKGGYKDTATDERWSGAVNQHDESEAPPGEIKPDARPMEFARGKIVAIDCSASPGAVLTLLAGAYTWKLSTPDRGKLVLIGADSFSCAWVNQKAAVNFRRSAEGAGELVSLEIQ